MARLLSKTPRIADFSADVKSGVVKTSVEGGPARYRKDQIGVVSSVNVVWAGYIEEFEYLRAFYRAATLNGSQAFDIYLPLFTEALTFCEGVYFIPGSFRLLSKSGGAYTMGARLAVRIQ